MNLKKGWILHVNDEIWKYIEKIPHNNAERIVATMDGLSENPFGGDSKKIQGEPNPWRRRVGSYRILYRILTKEKAIWVISVARRTSSTY